MLGSFFLGFVGSVAILAGVAFAFLGLAHSNFFGLAIGVGLIIAGFYFRYLNRQTVRVKK